MVVSIVMFNFQGSLYANTNKNNISIYAYAHKKDSEHIKKLEYMLNSAKLVPENIICGIGGFEESGEYYNWDCDLFFDNHNYIGAIESSQNQLHPKNAVVAIKKLEQSNKYYGMVDAITLDCEPFYQGNINNVAFHTEFINKINKPISVYVNPKNLVALREQDLKLSKFVIAIKLSVS